ncbi:MAG: hypothetical protein OYH77_08005 [Pseudomonadota bacterium]|nr:hypothetical protein [Pseudomonadota bacterium]
MQQSRERISYDNLNKFNLLIRIYVGLDFVLYALAVALFSLLIVILSQLLHGFSQDTCLALWLLLTLLALCCYRRRSKPLSADELLLQMDMDYEPSPYQAPDKQEFSRQKLQAMQTNSKDLLKRRGCSELQQFSQLLLQIAALIVCCSAVFMSAGITFAQLLPLPIHSQITLQILPDSKVKPLSTKQTATIPINSDNLVRITVQASALTAPPLLSLRQPDEAEFFQEVLFSRTDEGIYQLTMRIEQTAELLINSLHQGKVLARFELIPPTLPQVQMNFASKIATPHPDDSPIALMLVVSSRSALANVELEISSATGETQHELVHQFSGNAKHSLATTYQTVLEPYVEADYTEVMLVAVATDRNGSQGRSEPLTVQLVSAYGRYLHTLKTLRTLKTKLDEKIANQHGVSNDELVALMRVANQQAQASPFFDVRDRNTLVELYDTLRRAQQKTELLLVAEQLDLFLLEHEMINHRERDRDFFVAMHRLAWAKNSKKDLKPMLDKIGKFITERRRIWQQRVELLPDTQKPPNWSMIKRERPFMQALGKLRRTPSDEQLSATVNAYQSWISELEEHEDKVRQRVQQEVQRKVSAAQRQLKAMQKRQASISKALDKADQQSQTSLHQNWTTSRRQQNSNIKQAKRLHSQLAQVSRLAAMRMAAATQAMQEVKTCGDEQKFVCAESKSDLAGRLLHQTNNATRSRLLRHQRQARQVVGGNYFGQAITSGKIELQRDYKVNRRYREDILEQIQNSNLLEKHPDLLDSYLRKVLR